MLYFKLRSGKIVSSADVCNASKILNGTELDITNNEIIRDYVLNCYGIECEVEQPDIENLVREGSKFKAIKIYHENHNCTLNEAREYVESIESRLSN